MRVLLLGKYMLPRNGGVERHLSSLLHGLSGMDGVRATLLTANDGWGTAVERVAGFDIVKVSRLIDPNRLPLSPVYPRVISQLAEVIPLAPSYPRWLRRLSDADVIHLHAPNPIAEAAILHTAPDRPLVVTEHCSIPPDAPFASAYRKLHAAVLDRADAFIVQSPSLLANSLLAPDQRERAHVIPSCLDRARMAPDRASARRLLATLSPTEPLVLFVGRLVDYKGVDVLLRAMVEAPGTVVIVGMGPQEHRLKAVAKRLGLAGRAHFPGVLDDATLMGLMEAADVLVLPSTDDREGFGLVLLESHLVGTPTISTELGTGTSWVNEDGRTGLVVPARDPGAIAGAIRHIADHPEEAAAWGQAARTRALREFSLEEMARRTVEVYRRATRQASAR